MTPHWIERPDLCVCSECWPIKEIEAVEQRLDWFQFIIDNDPNETIRVRFRP